MTIGTATSLPEDVAIRDGKIEGGIIGTTKSSPRDGAMSSTEEESSGTRSSSEEESSA
jgi:hypothetical protein